MQKYTVILHQEAGIISEEAEKGAIYHVAADNVEGAIREAIASRISDHEIEMTASEAGISVVCVFPGHLTDLDLGSTPIEDLSPSA